MSQFMPKEAEISFSLSVHSQQSSDLASDTEVDSSGSATLGFGMFKAHASFSAKEKVHVDNQRESDQTSTCSARLLMERIDPPEIIMKIIDAICVMADKVGDMSMKMVEAQVNKVLKNNPDGLAAPSDNGDGNGNNQAA